MHYSRQIYSNMKTFRYLSLLFLFDDAFSSQFLRCVLSMRIVVFHPEITDGIIRLTLSDLYQIHLPYSSWSMVIFAVVRLAYNAISRAITESPHTSLPVSTSPLRRRYEAIIEERERTQARFEGGKAKLGVSSTL